MPTENNKTLRLIAAFLGIIVAVIMVVALKQLQSVMLPLSVAILLSFILGPLVEYLNGKKIPLPLSMFLMVVVVFSVFYLMGLLIYSSSNQFMNEFPKYEARVTTMMHDTLTYFDIPLPRAQEYINQLDWKEALGSLSLPEIISSTLGSFFGFLGKLIMVTIISLFIIPGRKNLGVRLHKMFEHHRALVLESMLESVNSQVQLYLVTKTAISLATGVLFALVLWILGVDFPVMWGFLAFVLNFIPTIGSIIATLPPVLICFVQFGIGWKVVLAALFLSAIQMVMGNVIEPRIMGKRLNISPLVVILSLIFWGWLWGIPGMILAVPITAAIKIACENIDPLKPIGVLLSGK
ncbi:MAG: AI-2E family transporter [candidate division Zixibacteria bacterium]|nr:AI-2E family transporter [candidate division Zixibacteria bacterium]